MATLTPGISNDLVISANSAILLWYSASIMKLYSCITHVSLMFHSCFVSFIIMFMMFYMHILYLKVYLLLMFTWQPILHPNKNFVCSLGKCLYAASLLHDHPHLAWTFRFWLYFAKHIKIL